MFDKKKKTENRKGDTAWKLSVFGVILVRIFPHSDCSLVMKETTGVFNLRSPKQTNYSYFVFYLYFTLVKTIILLERNRNNNSVYNVHMVLKIKC